MVIARKQVLVQLDDDLVARLDVAATTLGISRSELIRRAAQATLDAIDNIEHDRQLQEAYRRQPEERDGWLDAAARLSFESLDKW